MGYSLTFIVAMTIYAGVVLLRLSTDQLTVSAINTVVSIGASMQINEGR